MERRLTAASTSGGLSVRKAMDRRCVRSSLAFWYREAWADRLECPLCAVTLSTEVPTLGGREVWYGVGGPITFGYKVYGILAWSRTWGGDGGGTIVGSAVGAEISTDEDRKDFGGAFLSSDVIIWGWGAWYRAEAAGAEIPGW